jgi:hypothetical protein
LFVWNRIVRVDVTVKKGRVGIFCSVVFAAAAEGTDRKRRLQLKAAIAIHRHAAKDDR